MTGDGPSRVLVASSADPEVQRAFASARETFRYFWRELAWEKRRIVKGLDFAYVKAAFSDGGEVEHLWRSSIGRGHRGEPAATLPSPRQGTVFGVCAS